MEFVWKFWRFSAAVGRVVAAKTFCSSSSSPAAPPPASTPQDNSNLTWSQEPAQFTLKCWGHKIMFTFGQCPKEGRWGVGGYQCLNFLALFHQVIVPKIGKCLHKSHCMFLVIGTFFCNMCKILESKRWCLPFCMLCFTFLWLQVFLYILDMQFRHTGRSNEAIFQLQRVRF